MDKNYHMDILIPLAGFIIAVIQLYIASRFNRINDKIVRNRKDLEKLDHEFAVCKEYRNETLKDEISSLDTRISIIEAMRERNGKG